MRLSDIMSQMGLAIYPTIALVIFLVTFLGVAIYVLSAPREMMRRSGALPLDVDTADKLGESTRGQA